MILNEYGRWWDRAACAGRDPTWWSSEERPMWPAAVRLCLSCPVRDSCLQDAVQRRDNGVIRGGMLLVDTSRGYAAVPLICANCGLRPVRLTESGGVPRYCGRTCQVTSHQRGERARSGAWDGAVVSAGHRWAAEPTMTVDVG
jgi:Transcription factor WhiB